MISRYATVEDLEQALKETNKQYDNNIIWNREPEVLSRTSYRFTLRVKDSKKAGHRLGFCRTSKGNHRRLTSACWHVHGDFFDNLFKINPRCEIRAGNRKITKEEGNWQDRNIGSMMEPLLYSEACECNNSHTLEYKQLEYKDKKINTIKSRVVHQNNLTSECWLIQFQGLEACTTCEFLNTSNCGGKAIRQTLQNEKGLTVPIS